MLRRSWRALGPVTSYVTDAEGSLEYFNNFLAISTVVKQVDGRLEFNREGDRFVFGGDCFDRGTGDLTIANMLVDFKRRHPDDVYLLMGNRDINKMKLTAELHQTELNRVPEEVPRPFYIPGEAKYFSFADYVKKHKVTGMEQHSAVHRLKWMLSHTMGCIPTFELRRQELASMRAVYQAPSVVSDEDVVESYMSSLKPGGSVAEYLLHAQPVAVVDDSIFVHGAVNKHCVGFVPELRAVHEQPYFSDDDLGAFKLFSEEERMRIGGRPVPGHDMIRHDGASIEDWVDAINGFARAGVEEWLEQPTFDSPVLPELKAGNSCWGRRRGGSGLISYPHRSVMGKKTCVISTFVANGNLAHVDLGTVACLNDGGICRVIVGHQPSGFTPSFVRQPGLTVICADSSYCSGGMTSYANGRGMAVSEVAIDHDQGNVLVTGRDVEGTPYSFTVDERDEILGRRTADGWWSKAYRDDQSEVLMQYTSDAFYTTEYEWVPVGIARHRLNEGVVIGGCGGSINKGLRTEDLKPRPGCGSFGPTKPDTSRQLKTKRKVAPDASTEAQQRTPLVTEGSPVR